MAKHRKTKPNKRPNYNDPRVREAEVKRIFEDMKNDRPAPKKDK